MYAVGGRRLHVDVHATPVGVAAPTVVPTVVLEAALGASSLGWMFVERQVRTFAPTLAYDRAGLGWSAPGPRQQTLPEAVAELDGVLRQAVPSGPLVLVGHSYGALIVRYYAARHPARVAGLVLVDPPGLEEWAHPDTAHVAKLATGIRLARRGGWAARCGAARFVAWLIGIGALELAARCAVVVSGGKLREPSDFNFTPAILLPPDAKPILRWFWTRPCFYDALISQMEALPEAARLVAQAPPLTELPLAVLSAADTPPAQAAEHEGAARQSRRGQYLTARASGHWIPIEEPETVIAAVRSVVAQAVGMQYDLGKSAL